MAKLFFTTAAFRPLGCAVLRVPVLLDKNMCLVEPACAWFMHLALTRGRTRSRDTWRTYGEALYDWWQTLEASDWRWDEVTALHVATYRDRMLSEPSGHTKRPYSRSTINGRIRTLGAFYNWSVHAGLLDKAPFSTTDLQVRRPVHARALLHLDTSGGRVLANELTVRHSAGLPHPLSLADIRRLLNGLSVRDRLIVEWSLMTGVRRMEAAALAIKALPSRADLDALCAIRLLNTKGSKPRIVYAPLPLVDRTRAYIREERAVLVSRRLHREPTFTEPTTIFLLVSGEAMTPRNVGEMFALAARRAGLAASFHALRHTFATTMLRLLQRQAAAGSDINPLLTLQALLGHADISTTEVYLRVLATDLTAVEQVVDDLYAALG